MQGIYTYIPETNYAPSEYSVAAILLLLFMVLISLVSVLNLLYFYVSIFRSVCAVSNMAVFCSSLTSCFPGILLTYIIIIIIIIIIITSGSADLKLLDNKLWAVLEDMAFRNRHKSLESLRRSLVKAAAENPLETERAATTKRPEHIKACVESEGGHFE